MGVPTVAVAGLGGFAGEHHAALMALETEGLCRVVATCDPRPPLAALERFRLAERGVPVYSSLDELLARYRPDLVTLPTPIPLHAAQHRAAVEAGAAVYLEKPPSLWWPEFQAMLQADRGATRVGFNFVADPFRQAIKTRIDAGEFGSLREARFYAYWPRDAAYYARNNWAGRLRVGERWVLDSCIGNATAHYVQNLLFWSDAREIDELRAWAARTRAIDSFDTALVEARVGSATLRLGVTHAEASPQGDRETLLFEKARVTFERWDRARIEWEDGRVEMLGSPLADQAALLRFNLSEALAGTTHRATSLKGATAFVALCGLALVSSGTVHDISVPPDLAAFVEGGGWPMGVPERVGMADLERLESVAKSIAFKAPLALPPAPPHRPM